MDRAHCCGRDAYHVMIRYGTLIQKKKRQLEVRSLVPLPVRAGIWSAAMVDDFGI